MQEIIQKIEKQEIEISYIKETLEKLAIQTEKQSNQLQKISESIQKQELILEKISNLEEKYQEGMKRVHKRIDDEIHRCNDRVTKIENETPKKIENEIDYIEEKINKLEKNIENCCNRPCISHDVFKVELENVKKQQERFYKIFYWGATLIIGIVIAGIVKSHFH